MTTAQLQAQAWASYYRASSAESSPLAKQYDRYQAGQPFAPCWLSMLGVRAADEARIPRALDTIAQRLGQMHPSASFAPVRREVQSALTMARDGDVIVVNCPPGSKKTAVLQDAMAVLFTQAALKKERPPILVGISATRELVNSLATSLTIPSEPAPGAAARSSTGQVVTENFKELSRPGFTTRWLPAGNKIGFGMLIDTQESSLLDPFLTEANLIELAHGPGLHLTRRHFLRAFNTAFPSLSDSPPTVAEAQEKLHEQLTAISRRLTDIQNAAINIQGSFPGLLADAQYQNKKLRELAAAEALYNTLSAAHQNWQKKSNEGLLSKTAASLFGSNRKKQGEAISTHINELRGIPEQVMLELETASKKHIDEGDAKGFAALLQQESTDALNRVRIQEGQVEAIEELLTTWTEITLLVGGTPGKMSIDECDQLLDTTLRAQAFWLAVHIFEARWIDAMAQSHWGSSGPAVAADSPDAVRSKLQLYNMLTPCLVSSPDRLPMRFAATDAENQPISLWNEIDLLMVDEANQIGPEYVGNFALAKRALVLGDICQTLPDWQIMEADDLSKAQANLGSVPWADMRSAGRAVSSGNLMQMARGATPFMPYPELGPGMYLTRHDHSVDTIIGFCNQLCYQGKLQPARPDSTVDRTTLSLPALGWAHINGMTVSTDRGMHNLPEAKSVAAWIHHNLDTLQKHYHLTIGRVVAVLVPFAAQAAAVREELVQLGINDPIVIGTPRELSGTYRPVVLFSSVYTWCDDISPVFDDGPRFLNVAVSRAIDSFLVFGDMGLYRPDTDSPSGLLASHLFQSVDNAINSDPAWASRPDLMPDDATSGALAPLTTPEQHTAAMQAAFERTKTRIVIIAPWFSDASTTGQALPLLAASAIQRGANCMVFISPPEGSGSKSPALQRFCKALTDVGATVELIRSVRANLIFIDGREMFVGSGSWLSNRTEGQQPDPDKTVHYHSPRVAAELARVVKGLVARRYPPVEGN